MQEVTHDKKEYKLPLHSDGDKEWLIAMLYSVNTRNFEAGPQLVEIQREARMLQYEETYRRVMKNYTSATGSVSHKGPNAARRKANIELRKRIESIKAMNRGETIGLNTFTI